MQRAYWILNLVFLASILFVPSCATEQMSREHVGQEVSAAWETDRDHPAFR